MVAITVCEAQILLWNKGKDIKPSRYNREIPSLIMQCGKNILSPQLVSTPKLLGPITAFLLQPVGRLLATLVYFPLNMCFYFPGGGKKKWWNEEKRLNMEWKQQKTCFNNQKIEMDIVHAQLVIEFRTRSINVCFSCLLCMCVLCAVCGVCVCVCVGECIHRKKKQTACV